MSQSQPSQKAGRGERWPALDAARGAAIAAMVVYHLAWDLSFFRLIPTDVINDPAWQVFARTTAASFLVLVGVGLAIAHHGGVRWRAFWRRLGVIAAAALAITAVTRLALPDDYIFFGILHCIALSSLLALPFLRAPAVLLVGTAAVCFSAPLLFTDPALDHPALDWLGLGAEQPVTNDYVPVFPWFGFVLLGIVAGRLVLPLAARATPTGPFWRSPPARGLAWSGRRSLLIYLLHQPLLLGILFLVVQITGPNPAAEEAYFDRTCRAGCLERDLEAGLCAKGCACAAERLKAEGLWRLALEGTSSADQERVTAATGQCFRTPSSQ